MAGGRIPYQIDPKLGVQLVDQELAQAAPATAFEYVTVIFNSIANNDTDIVHALATTNVDYVVVGWNFASAPATVPVVYRDVSGTARAWGNNYVVLRCNVSSAQATLLLTARRFAINS